MYSDNKINLLHLMLPKTSVYLKSYDGRTEWMYLLAEYDDLLKIYNNFI